LLDRAKAAAAWPPRSCAVSAECAVSPPGADLPRIARLPRGPSGDLTAHTALSARDGRGLTAHNALTARERGGHARAALAALAALSVQGGASTPGTFLTDDDGLDEVTATRLRALLVEIGGLADAARLAVVHAGVPAGGKGRRSAADVAAWLDLL